MTTEHPTDILLGIGFGEVLPNDIGILASMHVRTNVNGKLREGVRDPIIMQAAILEQLQEHMPKLLETMKQHGLDADTVPISGGRIAWNAGPTLQQAQQTGLFLCTGFGFNDPAPEDAVPIAYIEGVSAHDVAAKPQGGEYVMPYRVLVEFAEAIPKALDALKRGNAPPAGVGIDFDFTKLNFKWDRAKRKVTMNRGYLSEFLRANGVTTLPGMQEMMDLMANLYLIHRKQGRPKIPQMDAFLDANGISIKEHDPATITPARRRMDGSMDAILSDARQHARDAASPADFWRWLDAEIAPVEAHARENGEAVEFERRYGEVLQLAKDAGLARTQ